jgi:hypothetical protein
MEVLEDNDFEDESEDISGTSSEESEESGSAEETSDVDEQVTISKSELDKLRRESFAAKRLREGKGKEGSKESNEKGSDYDKEMIERTFIAVHGKIEDSEVQDEAIRLARKFDMSVPDAMKDPDIKLRLDNLQKQKKARQAIAGQTGSAKNNNRGVDYHVEQYKTKGILPNDPAIIAKVLDKLAS